MLCPSVQCRALGRKSLTEIWRTRLDRVLKSGVTCSTLLVGDIGSVLGRSVVGLILMMLDLICSTLTVVAIVLVGLSCWSLLKKELLARPRTLNIAITVLVLVVILMTGTG